MKALYLLEELRDNDRQVFGATEDDLKVYDEAIAELEELMKPKSCECFEDVIFVWNESGNFIESIIVNSEDLALDIKKNYRVYIEEIKEQQ